VLLPYSAENYPLYIRGRGTGLVAGLSKAGGIAAQIVTMAGLVPALGAAAMILAAPIAASAALIAVNGIETRDRHLEQFDD
jgi:putative MFS transporter